jgi:Domain of unknown function (DUF1905)
MEPTGNEDLAFRFSGELFEWTSTATSWFFIRVPPDQSAELREQMDGLTGRFGSIRVEATIGDVVWKTSVFPESASRAYLLPVKKAVRKAEEIEPGDPVDVEIRVLLIE